MLELLIDCKLHMIQPCDVSSKRAKAILGNINSDILFCTNLNIASNSQPQAFKKKSGKEVQRRATGVINI